MGRLSKLFYKLGKKCDLEICTPMGLETFAYPARGSFSVGTNLYEPYCCTYIIYSDCSISSMYFIINKIVLERRRTAGSFRLT